MNWPWVKRGVAESLRADVATALKDLAGMATAIAIRDAEIDGVKRTLANMTIHCKMLETRQRDLDAPVISAEDLDKLHKQHAFRIRQVESLEEHNKKLEAELDQIKRPRSVVQSPSPVALVQG